MEKWLEKQLGLLKEQALDVEECKHVNMIQLSDFLMMLEFCDRTMTRRCEQMQLPMFNCKHFSDAREVQVKNHLHLSRTKKALRLFGTVRCFLHAWQPLLTSYIMLTVFFPNA